MTEGNTTITLHDESLDTIVGGLRTVANFQEMLRLSDNAQRLRTIADTIATQR